MVEKAMRETFFQDFIDKKIGEINEKKKMILKQFEDECENLAKKGEANLNKVVDFVLEKVLGVKS
jgi:vacuolar-type H+-ATPase subunit H